VGHVYHVKLVTYEDEEYHYDKQVLFNTIDNKNFNVMNSLKFILLCSSLLNSNGNVFYPGIDYVKYMQTYYRIAGNFHKLKFSENSFQ